MSELYENRLYTRRYEEMRHLMFLFDYDGYLMKPVYHLKSLYEDEDETAALNI